MLLTGCQAEQTEGAQIAEPSQATLRTKADLKALDLSIGHISACDLVDAQSARLDWSEDARLRLDLMGANCSLPTEDITQAQARAALGDDNIALTGEGDVLTIYQRTTGGEPFFCCSLQGLPNRAVIGDTVWVARQRLRQLDAANITMSANLANLDPEGYDIQPSGLEGEASWRGPNVPEMIEPIADENLRGAVTEHEIYSPQLEETRRIAVYAPPGLTADSPVIIAADGASLGGLVERLIRDGKIRPVLMIGVKSGQDGIVENRTDIGDTHALRSYDYFPSEV